MRQPRRASNVAACTRKAHAAMLTLDQLSQAGAALQVALVDILLSADNAVVIALACRGLQLSERRRAYVAGTVAAVAMRLLFASGIVFVLALPFLKLVGGAALLVIAIRLVVEELPAETKSPAAGADRVPAVDRTPLWRAVTAILVGDFVMSGDNVVAVTALANGSVLLLVAGLSLSIPLLVFGSALLQRLIGGNVALVFLAGMSLGWVAGAIAVSDPAIAAWVAGQAPALTITLPSGAAILVGWQALILRRRAALDAARRQQTGRGSAQLDFPHFTSRGRAFQ